MTGWLPYWSSSTAVARVVGHADLFTDASPFWFNTSAAGVVHPDASMAQLAGVVSALHHAHVKVLPTVTSSMRADGFARLLQSRSERRAEVRALVRVVTGTGADGIDLDFESINAGSSSARATVKARYPGFAEQLHAALAARGKLLSVTVPARTSDADPNWAVYDYAGLGRAADRFRIMTYDYHWGGGPPGPIAPRPWVRSVLAYAVTRVPHAKISFGLPNYGRDWYLRTRSGTCPGSAHQSVARTASGMQAFVAARGITPTWSAADASMTFRYIQRYSVGHKTCRAVRVGWYENAQSVRSKMRLVRHFEVRGVALWALGDEASHTWRSLTRFGLTSAVHRSRLRMRGTSVVFGHRGVIRGTLRAGGHRVARAHVVVQRRNRAGRWVATARATTGRRGQVRVAVQPRRATHYRLAVGRDWSRTRAVSAPRVVQVRYAVAIGRPRARVLVAGRGQRIGVHGTVSPSQTGRTVQLQRWSGTRWVVRATTTTGARGGYAFAARFAHRARHELRCVVSRGRLARGVSRSFIVSVR